MDSEQAIKFELINEGNHSAYVLRRPAEIAAILRAMGGARGLLSAFYDDSGGFALTSVLAVDAQRGELTLDHVADAAAGRALLAAPRIVVVGSHQRVRVQFVLCGISQALYQERPALRAALPQALLRLQRREYYRLATPVANPVKCVVPLPAGSVEKTVLDISCGGVCLLVHRSDLVLDPGTVYPDCQLEIPRLGVVRVNLRISHTYDVTPPGGVHGRRSGCEFVDLGNKERALIQRYVISLERERNARITGLG